MSPGGREWPTEGSGARERWKLVRELFERAISQPAEERASFVRRLQDSEGLGADVVDEVRALLAADEGYRTDRLSDRAPDLIAEFDSDAALETRMAGRVFGSWIVRTVLGRGGMGMVCLVERHADGVMQLGALKLVRSGWDNPALQHRFRAERRILAALEHPGIARLLDAGSTDDGEPWLVMEYVRGNSIVDHGEKVQASLPQRLEWFLQVCDALAHAHRNLVVHRDLKPGNILIDDSGRVKLLDFGIAKLLEEEEGLTSTGERLYTPEYAAPEQVRGEPVTTSVDVHALGVLLFELLSGERPWPMEQVHPAARALATLEQEPRRPSHVAACGPSASSRSGLQRQWANRLRGDLDAITLKALRKQPADRYASVSDMADDVRRYLQRQPVLARRGNWRYRTRRFLQRHALVSVFAAATLLAIVLGMGATWWQALQAEAARQAAEREAAVARAVADFMTGVFARANPDQSGKPDPSAGDVLDLGAQALADDDGLQPAIRLALLAAVSRAYTGLGYPQRGLDLLDAHAGLLGSVGDTEAAVAARLARAIALNRLGDQSAALLTLEPIEARSGELAPGLRAEFDYVSGLAYSNLRENSNALPRLWRAYTELRAAEGIDEPLLRAVIPVLVSVLSGEGWVEEAMQIASEAWERAKQGKFPAGVQIAYGNAYGLSLLSSKPEQAEVVFGEVLRIAEALYGDDSPRLATHINNVGLALMRQARGNDAERMYRRSLALHLAQQAPDPLVVARTEMQLARVALRAGRPADAVKWIDSALTRWDSSGRPLGDSYLGGLLTAVEAQEALADDAAVEALLRRAEPFLDGELRQLGYLYRPRGLLLRARLMARQQNWAAGCGDTAEFLETRELAPLLLLQARILHAHCERSMGRPWQSILQSVSPDEPLLGGMHDTVRSLWAELQAAGQVEGAETDPH